MKEAIKRILVPIDPSIFTGAATETACRIAHKHQAEISGIAVLDSAEIRSSLVPAIGPYYPMMIDAVNAKVKHAESILAHCKARFAMVCEEYDVHHLETEYEGIPAQKLLSTAIFFDLIVTGLENAFHFETRGESVHNSLTELLEETATPIVAVPAMGMGNLQKVVIAFDGSVASARALRDFIGFAQPYDPEITVFTAKAKGSRPDFLLRKAKEYLAAHGLTRVAVREFEDSVEKAAESLVRDDTDLVVAGIHSRKPLRDFFTGSFTKHMIEKGNTALFLSH